MKAESGSPQGEGDGKLKSVKEGYLEYLESVRGLSPRTLSSYAADLGQFEAYLLDKNIEAALPEDVRGFIASLSQRSFSETSINRMLSALRGLFSYCVKYGLCQADPCLGLRGLKTKRSLPQFLFADEAAALLDLPNGKDFASLRDRALLEFFYSTGCRLSEVTGLRVKDLSLPRAEARVMGKGSKERIVFLNSKAKEALAEYLRIRAARLSGRADSGFVFLSQRLSALSPRGAAYIVYQWARRSNLGKNLHPHTFRHSLATHLLDRGADIRIVQEILGHSSVSTTQIYTHVSLERLKKVYTEAHPHA